MLVYSRFALRRAYTSKCIHEKLFHTSRTLLSEVNPVYPDDSHLTKIKKPGMLFSEPIDPNLRMGYNPLYSSPVGGQIAFTKRWSIGLSLIGSYVGYLVHDVTGASDLAGIIGAAVLIAPLPLVQFFAGNYVTNIYRLYRKDEPQTYENLTKDETIVLERIGLFGRKTYATAVKVQDLRLVNKRFGWVNWEYKDPKTNFSTKFYVADNIGGMKMDRIWGIIEKNSGVDNGRSFLNEP
ncbi:D-tyrosyl-tRNA(Tyr) deacylase [Sugiyamaella lignohabitans]|uniref:D-tyrosyl-tRNA(Tyr) deacylase n=1 Tax=Sugiyamaella lignohabitans TaxID=796027 RepID=A0A167BYC7_9ASCO|nr:D-tyrosyl-tRNA(Tyr) deacylase [Sugiyamaella lignohabitans]ANB10976.1 D-tyrosyl-tRNA(Tyr) deacylase [Sugiyamaella lignohabitans]